MLGGPLRGAPPGGTAISGTHTSWALTCQGDAATRAGVVLG